MLGEPFRRRLLRDGSVETWDRLAEVCRQCLSKGRLVAVEDRSHDELAHLVRVLRCGEQGDPAAQRIADEIRLVEPQVVDERRSASAGRIGQSISPDPSPPCSRIIGRPAPWVSK